jgi:hypothetical protein
MEKQIRLSLGANQVGQILDGLEIRAEAWRKTAAFLETDDPGDDFFLIEECSSSHEARAIANDYATIISKLRKQYDSQRPPRLEPKLQSRPESGTVPAFAVYIETICQGRVPLERDQDNMPVTYVTECDAQLSIADSIVDRLDEFLRGQRDFEDAITVEEYVEAVDLHPDGSITDEHGNIYPNPSW